MKFEITLTSGDKVTHSGWFSPTEQVKTVVGFIRRVSPAKTNDFEWHTADDGSLFEFRHIVRIREIKD